MVNETVSKNRRFIIKVPQPRWECIAANTEFIDWKIKNNITIQKIIRNNPEIIARKKENIMDEFVMTKKYSNFNGCIITDELIFCNNQEIPIKAEWDTGATYSCISTELVESLGLEPIKTVLLDTSGGQVKSKVYKIDLILNDDIQISVEANSSDNFESKGIQCLIGMDIIVLGDFAISTYNNETCFSFRIPSKGHIDFTKK